MKTTLILLLVFSSLSSYGQIDGVLWEKTIFDSASIYISIDTSVNNIWQIGSPQKVCFDSAFSKRTSIVTDTVNSYPVANNSNFDIIIGEFNHQGYIGNAFIEFTHKFDTDTLKDGGYITVSYDKGETWTNIIEDHNWMIGEFIGVENIYNLYDSLANGEAGFSGKSNSWLTTSFGWAMYPSSLKSTVDNSSDTTIIRFNFFSDQIDNKRDGWLIDNIKFFTIDLGSDIQETENNSSHMKVYPNPVVDKLFIEFDKMYSNIEIEVITIEGKNIISNKYKNQQKIEIDKLDDYEGIYLIRIKLDKELVLTKQILINN